MSSLQEATKVAQELGYTVTTTKAGAIEFKRPNGHAWYLIKDTPEAFNNAIASMREETAGSNNMNVAAKIASTATIVQGPWMRSGHFGAPSWYRHDEVSVNGVKIGSIQYRKGSRTDSTTCFQNSCVRGADLVWLIAQAIGKGLIQVPEGMPIQSSSKTSTKIKLSKSQWEQIGQKGGWMKKASTDFALHPDPQYQLNDRSQNHPIPKDPEVPFLDLVKNFDIPMLQIILQRARKERLAMPADTTPEDVAKIDANIAGMEKLIKQKELTGSKVGNIKSAQTSPVTATEKTIRVIKWKGQYIKDYEYSQGYRSEELTDNPLHAMDLNHTQFNADFALQLYGREPDAFVETYDVILVKRSSEKIPPPQGKPNEKT